MEIGGSSDNIVIRGLQMCWNIVLWCIRQLPLAMVMVLVSVLFNWNHNGYDIPLPFVLDLGPFSGEVNLIGALITIQAISWSFLAAMFIHLRMFMGARKGETIASVLTTAAFATLWLRGFTEQMEESFAFTMPEPQTRAVRIAGLTVGVVIYVLLVSGRYQQSLQEGMKRKQAREDN